MKVVKFKNIVFARMDENEDFFENLEKIVEKTQIKSGVIVSCIGQLKNVELAYFDLKEKKYVTKTFEDVFELLSASGNISFFGNQPTFHVHVVLGNKNFGTIGGHLNKAKVGATVELMIYVPPILMERKWDQKKSLKILDFAKMEYEY